MRKFSLLLLACGLVLAGHRGAVAQQDNMIVAGRTLQGWAKDLDSENEIVRLRAVKSLGPFGASATEVLRQALDDSSAGVRYWAASHLGAIGPQAHPAQVRLNELKEDASNPAVQMAAAFGLCRIENVDAHVQLLLDRLDYPERGMACSAAEFLGRLGPDGKVAMVALERTFHAHSRQANPLRKEDPDYHIHGACQNALRQIDPQWKPGSPGE